VLGKKILSGGCQIASGSISTVTIFPRASDRSVRSGLLFSRQEAFAEL
jgi:hypothetical protein